MFVAAEGVDSLSYTFLFLFSVVTFIEVVSFIKVISVLIVLSFIRHVWLISGIHIIRVIWVIKYNLICHRSMSFVDKQDFKRSVTTASSCRAYMFKFPRTVRF